MPPLGALVAAGGAGTPAAAGAPTGVPEPLESPELPWLLEPPGLLESLELPELLESLEALGLLELPETLELLRPLEPLELLELPGSLDPPGSLESPELRVTAGCDAAGAATATSFVGVPSPVASVATAFFFFLGAMIDISG